ncbi:unnamed protein product [Blepharisma stoltei]|uniref:Uncharacterized protein n=1 Tax=Blepharisma stoltei TaxID=1481888 RepID=A0AAU9K0P5_9CILI|nr:unnamed protein product [Blepharisma stoltei]
MGDTKISSDHYLLIINMKKIPEGRRCQGVSNRVSKVRKHALHKILRESNEKANSEAKESLEIKLGDNDEEIGEEQRKKIEKYTGIICLE